MFKTVLKSKENQQTMSNMFTEQKEFTNRVDSKDGLTNKQGNSIFLNEQKNTATNELGTIMDGKTDKCKVIVNGEKITEREIAYIDFQINNTVLNEQQEKKDAINEAIKEYVVVQDAKQRNIFSKFKFSCSSTILLLILYVFSLFLDIVLHINIISAVITITNKIIIPIYLLSFVIIFSPFINICNI